MHCQKSFFVLCSFSQKTVSSAHKIVQNCVHCQKSFFLVFRFITLILAFISSFDSLTVPFVTPRLSQFAAPLVCEMSVPHTDAAVAAAATAATHLVRLDEFTEHNIEQWFNSHTWQFHNNRVTKSADKYALARAKLPRSIMDAYTSELDALFLREDPYEALRHFLISQFGKSKWISYFELLRLPVIVEDIRPLAVFTKLKSLLPFGADQNNEIFMAMFLLRLPPSTREQVGSAEHTTVAAMVSHADRVWSFRGG